MRKAMIGSETCGGTLPSGGATGLAKFGVPASHGMLPAITVISKVLKNIPIDIAVNYALIPHQYRQDINFNGNHSVLACKRATQAGRVNGILVRDPDRWGTGKVDSVFWPDSVWIRAYENIGSLAVWPNNAKIIPTTPVTHGIYVEPNADIRIYTVVNKCIKTWADEKWGNTHSSASCSAEYPLTTCSGSSTVKVVTVTSGKYKGKILSAHTNGVTVKDV
jgi:hypothetical protein